MACMTAHHLCWLMLGSIEHLNGKEFNGRAIIADGRNADKPILVRDLRVCKPTGLSGRPSSGGGRGTAASATPESPLHATGGPVSYPDPSMLSSSASTASPSFSQVGPTFHTVSSHPRHHPQGGSGARQYRCFMSMPMARALMHRIFSQGGDGYNMSLPPANFMASADTSFAHSVMPIYDNSLATGFAQPAPLLAYGFGLGPNPVQTSQSFVTYTTSPDVYNPATSYAVQPPYNDFYPPATTTLTDQMANMDIGGNSSAGAGGGGVIYTEQRGIQIRDISRRASGDQIRKMIREVAGPEVSLVNAIEVPYDKDGNPRGLAFVHFGTADLARRMASHLNGVEFKGRKLQVRLMKDGEAIIGGSGGGSMASTSAASTLKPHRGSKHHHNPSSKDDKRRSERISGSGSGSASKSPPSSSRGKNVPLVVGGSVTAKSASATPSSTKDKGKRSSVIIADGSSCGRGAARV